jgi:hypothetical protein
VVLIWDGLKAHRARLIEGFVPGTRAIYPVVLAPYAPELNSIEYAWDYLKHHPWAQALSGCICSRDVPSVRDPSFSQRLKVELIALSLDWSR